MSVYNGQRMPGFRSVVGYYGLYSAPTFGSFPTNTAYVAGVSGNCALSRHVLSAAATLTTIYYCIVSSFGSPSTITLEMRSGTLIAPDMSPGGLLQSVVHNPGSATGWFAVSGWSVPFAAGVPRWLVIGDPSGAGLHFANIVQTADCESPSHRGQWMDWTPYDSADGGQSLGQVAGVAARAFVFSDGGVKGQPFSTASLPAASTTQRGALVTPADSWSLGEVAFAPGDAQVTAVNIWTGDSGPSGSPSLHATWLTADATPLAGGVTFPPFTMVAGTPYRVVCAFAGAGQAPRKISIGSGADATLRSLMPLPGTWRWTEEIAGVWVDDADAIPQLGLGLQALP